VNKDWSVASEARGTEGIYKEKVQYLIIIGDNNE